MTRDIQIDWIFETYPYISNRILNLISKFFIFKVIYSLREPRLLVKTDKTMDVLSRQDRINSKWRRLIFLLEKEGWGKRNIIGCFRSPWNSFLAALTEVTMLATCPSTVANNSRPNSSWAITNKYSPLLLGLEKIKRANISCAFSRRLQILINICREIIF